LPPPPQPSENPITEAKRVLGKILFWEEQLSSNSAVACGSCHSPANGGGDPRVGVNPGFDELALTADDVVGSPGVPRTDSNGVPVDDPLFGFEVQVTGRSANTTIGAAYAPELFHDGRAGTVFTDPESMLISIAVGGALENQAIGPILSDVEMAFEGRDWDEVRAKLSHSVPLVGASGLPADVSAALAANPGYADLFAAAFGSVDITADRIAFAIAGYERTLVADQTPWDAFMRRGETQNCVAHHSSESCIFPIEGGGRHRDTEPSLRAHDYLLELLKRTPPTDVGHLRARWLLNVVAMTLGTYPDGVPKQYLIPPARSTFPSIAGSKSRKGALRGNSRPAYPLSRSNFQGVSSCDFGFSFFLRH
jgi:hypothetical protein